MKYMITETECRNGISGVCSRCGGELSPMDTVDNSGNPTFWCGCKECCCFDNGVSAHVYNIARRLVVEQLFYRYSFYKDEPGETAEMKEYHQKQQISGACDIVRKVLWLAEEETEKNVLSPHAKIAPGSTGVR